MKKYLVVLMVVVIALATLNLAYADLESRATRTVFATINPNVTLAPLSTIAIDAGTYQTGDIFAQVGFRVDANKEQVALYVEASGLYKGADPQDPTVLPIPLKGGGVSILPTDAGPFPGQDNIAAFVGTGTPVDGFPMVRSETINFESSQAGHFSQDVIVVISWSQTDPELPMGIYTGKVTLVGFLLPDEPPTGGWPNQ